MDQNNKAQETVSQMELPIQRFQNYPWGQLGKGGHQSIKMIMNSTDIKENT